MSKYFTEHVVNGVTYTVKDPEASAAVEALGADVDAASEKLDSEISRSRTFADAQNAMDGVGFTEGYAIPASGTPEEHTWYHYSDLIPVGGKSLLSFGLITAAGPSYAQAIRIHAYDEDGEWIAQLKAVSFTPETAAAETPISICDVPVQCHSVRVSLPTPCHALYMRFSDVVKDETVGAVIDGAFSRTACSWAVGSIDYVTGEDYIPTAANSRIRSNGYIDLSTRFVASTLTQIVAYVYDRAETFLGTWTGKAIVTGSVTWSQLIDVQAIYQYCQADHPDCLIRVIARYSTNSDIAVADASDIKFYAFAEDKLYASISLYQTWAVCGASFDSGSCPNHGSNVYSRSWPQILARRSGNVATNYSKGGNICKTFISDTSEHGLSQALADDPKELYVLTFGGNDANNQSTQPKGTPADMSTHADTFYGNYAYILDALMEHAPEAKFVLTTPSSPWYTAAQVEYDEAVRNIAEHYGLPLIVWESDDFMRSNCFLKHQPSNHPTPIGYSGMALAFERLFSKAVQEYGTYFNAFPD